MVKKARKKEQKQLHVKLAKKRISKLVKGTAVDDSFSHVKNKRKRAQLVFSSQLDKKAKKSKARRSRFEAEKRGEKVERKIPNTIERLREEDETIIPPDDEEVVGEEDMDEFEPYFKDLKTPKIMITTCVHPSGTLFNLLKEIVHVIPGTTYYKRKGFALKKIIEYAKKKDFTDIIVFSEKSKKPNGMYLCHLPDGPTAYFKLTKLKLGAEIKGGATCNTSHNPELILNNFTTRLGLRVGRFLAALFPQAPDFHGRRTVTFHSQRDFIFFRHYRYVFRDDGTKVGLQEIGPRFTLKLRYLQHGTFDPQTGEFEFLWRPDSQVSKKRMFI